MQFSNMLRRFYHTTCILHSKSVKRQGVNLLKMLNPNKKKRTSHYDILPSTKSLVKTTKEPGKPAIRRVAILNKLFMKYITDIMTTGNLSVDLLGRGIEISKVKVTPDFQMINVYWLCKGTLSDVETEKILNTIAGALRHELSTLRLMGEIPYITFLKDQQEAKLYRIDQKLSIADYGEDYVPTEIGHVLKTEFSIETKLSPEMKAKIKQLEEEFPTEETPIPEMTNNVYGLDHTKILNRLLAARKKSQDAWKRMDQDSSVISYRVGETPPNKSPNYEALDAINQKKELAEFLLRRQILENKLHKKMKRNRKVGEVAIENNSSNDAEDDFDDWNDEDLYDDDEFYNDRLEDINKDKSIS